MGGRIVSILIAIAGAYWAITGWTQHGFWVNKGPGGGFLPVIIGTLTLLLSFPDILKGMKSVVKIERVHIYPIIGALLVIAFSNIFGMMITLGLFMIVWLIVLGKYTIPRAAIIGISTTAIVYVVFKLFLHVPFPTGFMGI